MTSWSQGNNFTAVLGLPFTKQLKVEKFSSKHALDKELLPVKQTIKDLNGFRANKCSRTFQVVCTDEA
jgi:hypothetical protein